MAEERDPAERPSAAGDSAAKTAALEARVARVEAALIGLQRQVAAGGATESSTVVFATVQEAIVPETGVGEAAAQVQTAGPVERRPHTPPPPVPAMFAAGRFPPAKGAAAAARMGGSGVSLESRLGAQVFNRIAIVSLLMGAAWGLKLAVDRGWIGPIARVAIGLIAGTGLVLWSERFRAKGFAAFSYSLKAVGSGVLYLSLWAAFRFFHLIPAPVALCLMILVTAWNAFMAWAQDSEVLAAYAIAGGFATPLLSTGGNHELFLFTYIVAIDIATVILIRLRGWPRLLLGAFPLTVGYYIGWYGEFYGIDAMTATLFFAALFWAVFASVPLGSRVMASATAAPRALKRSTLLEDILLPLCNTAFVALACYAILQDADDRALLPWVMVGLAALYLAIMRAPQSRTASAIHLSLAVVLLTIAIPLKASGHWITVSWLVEGLALMWVAARLSAATNDSTEAEDTGTVHAASVLRPLASASLLLGFCGICVHFFGLLDFAALPLWNKGTGTALTGIAVFAAVAWLALRAAATVPDRSTSWSSIATGSVLLIDITAAVLTLRELGLSWQWEYAHPAFRSADFATALIGLAVFAGVIAVSIRLARTHTSDVFWTQCAALSTIAFNLIALLTGVREVSAAFAEPPGSANIDAALQQALAISAWLMLYGALLLVIGFWRRSSFLRWQALVLLAITIVKAFLYDMRDLSQGYRVVSFLALGALLMVVSFAYQKDWLNLRGADPTQPDEEPPPSPSEATAADADPGVAQ
jgi:uncharacterized membrane protein